MEKKAKSTEVDDQLHAIWSVSSSLSAYIQATDGFCGKRFCFVLNKSRPLLQLETRFFETARAGKGLLSFHLCFKSQINIVQCLSSRYLPSSMI